MHRVFPQDYNQIRAIQLAMGDQLSLTKQPALSYGLEQADADEAVLFQSNADSFSK